MPRKLASIQRIWEILPIDGADNIELAKVLGWQCVVSKGQFKPMDMAVYFEIDSFLPIRPEFEFLRKSCYRKTDAMGEGFKIRTQKFKGCISQGLLLPIEKFPELADTIELGKNVAKLLGVKKWEIEEKATTGGTVIGGLPKDVPHTDEIRIQSAPDLLEDFRGLKSYISTKMDGSSHSISLDEDGFHVCGHNYEYKDDGKCSFYEFVKSKRIEGKVREYCEGKGIQTLTIQGEFCAPGIQRNRLKLTSPEWYVFTIRKNGKRVGLGEMLRICNDLYLQNVPIEEVCEDLPGNYPSLESLLARADGEYPNGGKKEGIVIRPVEPVYSEKISAALSFKVINNKYLLKNDD